MDASTTGSAAPRGDDAWLVEASRRGERAAFGQLVERYQRAVTAVSLSACGNRALCDDVAQDTFVTAWHRLGSLRDPARLGPWLCGIARNLGRKARRRRARELPLAAGEPDPGQAELIADGDPYAEVSAAEAEASVRRALARVPERYREVLVLYYQEGHSARQVASALGLSEAAVMQRLSRGRAQLARGVDELIERSLRAGPMPGAPPLRARVLAALPVVPALHVVTPSPARAPAKGSPPMLKIALATLLAGAAGTTAYVVQREPAPRTPAPAPIVAPPAPARATAAPRAATPSTPSTPTGLGLAEAPPLPTLPALAAGRHRDVEDLPLDRAVAERVRLFDGPSRGPADAPLTIVVFTDLACEFCAKALGTIDELVDTHPRELRVVAKQFPVRPGSDLPAKAVLAADAQGKFWEMHDLLFANQDAQTAADIERYAMEIGLDLPTFRRAMDQAAAAGVERDRAAGAALGVQGTPTFVIGDEVVAGALPVAVLRQKIEAALARR